MFRHAKEVLLDCTPTVLRYSIPLLVPQERLLFQSSTLILEVPFVNRTEIDLAELNAISKKPPKKIFLQAECHLPSFEQNLQMR
jgi:hypothetical protein